MIVDAHCHLADEGDKRQSVHELLRHMDRHGVDVAVLCPGDREIAVRNDQGNRRIAEAVRSHPDRFVGMAVANPWRGHEALAILGRARSDGLRGLKLHPPLQGFHLSDELADPLVGWCAEAGWPVYCHTGTPINSEPLQLTELARRHASVRFIMGHMGWSDFAYDMVNAASMADNILLETSHAVCGMVAAAIEALGPGRVVFGSDAPVSTLEAELATFSAFELSPTSREQIMGRVAAGLFGVEP